MQSELAEYVTNEEGSVHSFALDKSPMEGETSGLAKAIDFRHEKNREKKKNLF